MTSSSSSRVLVVLVGRLPKVPRLQQKRRRSGCSAAPTTPSVCHGDQLGHTCDLCLRRLPLGRARAVGRARQKHRRPSSTAWIGAPPVRGRARRRRRHDRAARRADAPATAAAAPLAAKAAFALLSDDELAARWREVGALKVDDAGVCSSAANVIVSRRQSGDGGQRWRRRACRPTRSWSSAAATTGATPCSSRRARNSTSFCLLLVLQAGPRQTAR